MTPVSWEAPEDGLGRTAVTHMANSPLVRTRWHHWQVSGSQELGAQVSCCSLGSPVPGAGYTLFWVTS